MNVSAKRSLTPSHGVGASFCNILFSISRLDELSIFVDLRNCYIGTISFPSILLSKYLLESWFGAKYCWNPSSGNVSLLAFLLCLRVPKSYLSFGLFFWPAIMENRRFGLGLMKFEILTVGPISLVTTSFFISSGWYSSIWVKSHSS